MNWHQAALTELESYLSQQPENEAERQAVCLAAIDGFHTLFHELVRELKIRDEWDTPLCEIAPCATGTVERSKKLENQRFTFAIGLDGWFIEAGLRYSDHIRHMTDEFWAQINKLASIGAASLSDSGVRMGPGRWASPESVRRLTQHKGSLVFSLARDYVLLMQQPSDGIYSPTGSLGDIQVTLPIESGEKEVRQFFKEGLAALYRANYLLHRSAYLSMKRFQRTEARQSHSAATKTGGL